MSANDSKRYFWVKLKKDFFQQHQIKVLKALPNGRLYALIYLELLAESVSHEGKLRFSNILPYDNVTLGAVIDEDPDNVKSALEWLQKLGMVEILDDQTLYLSQVKLLLGSETGQTIRKNRAKLDGGKIYPAITEDLPQRLEIRDKRLEIRDKEIYKESEDFVFEEQKPKETFASKVENFTQNEELRSALRDFIEMRKKSKGAFTLRAMDLALNTLTKITTDEETQIEVVNRTIENGWKSFFPLNGGNKKKETIEEKTLRLQREMEEEGYL